MAYSFSSYYKLMKIILVNHACLSEYCLVNRYIQIEKSSLLSLKMEMEWGTTYQKKLWWTNTALKSLAIRTKCLM